MRRQTDVKNKRQPRQDVEVNEDSNLKITLLLTVMTFIKIKYGKIKIFS